MEQRGKFVALLRLAMGISGELPDGMTNEDWQEVYQMACRQSVAGVMFRAVELVPESMRPEHGFLMRWFATKEQTVALNRKEDAVALDLTRFFADNGFRSCILKGQGNTRMYPDPTLRQPGDVDIWVEGGRKRVMDFLRSKGLAMDSGSYHHVHIPAQDGVPIEVHYRTGKGSQDPLANWRLQRWVQAEQGGQFDYAIPLGDAGSICIPTPQFNRVFQLCHMMRHFCNGGIGLRHLMDFYYLLSRYPIQPAERVQEPKLLKSFGMERFAGALAWVLVELFCIDESLLPVDTRQREGKVLLEEIMKGGNFGKHRGLYDDNFFRRAFNSQVHRWQLTRFFPSEMAWAALMHWWIFIVTIPARIRKGSWSLAEKKK